MTGLRTGRDVILAKLNAPISIVCIHFKSVSVVLNFDVDDPLLKYLFFCCRCNGVSTVCKHLAQIYFYNEKCFSLLNHNGRE